MKRKKATKKTLSLSSPHAAKSPIIQLGVVMIILAAMVIVAYAFKYYM